MTPHVDLAALPDSLKPKRSESPDVISDNELSGVPPRGQNCSLRKTLVSRDEPIEWRSRQLQFKCRLFVFPTTDAVIVGYESAIAAQTLLNNLQPAFQIFEPRHQRHRGTLFRVRFLQA